MKKKRLITFILLFITVALSITAGATNVNLFMTDSKLDLDARLINSVTYVPVIGFAALADTDICASWDALETVLTVDSAHVSLTLGKTDRYITANERCLYLPGEPSFIDGELYAPIRTLSEIYGMSITWRKSDKSVRIAKTGEYIKQGHAYYDKYDLYWLSRIISAESGGEPFLGQIAVGNVVLNRAASDLFPRTIYGVIFDNEHGVQFSPAANNSIYNAPTESSVAAAKVCLEGYSVTTSALYFLNRKIAKSNWIVNNRGFIMTIGNHSFYS